MNIQFQPAGEYALDLWKGQGVERILPPLLGQATSFGVTVPVRTHVVPGLTGKKKLRRVRQLLSSLPVPAARCRAYWAKRGPVSLGFHDAAVIITGDLADVSPTDLVPHNSARWWQVCENSWEDLFLFSGSKLHFYSCTHEVFGVAYGSEGMVGADRSLLRPIAEKDRQLRVHGELIDPETWDLMTALEM